jgi:preprotein translocase subunit SecF
VNPSDIRTTLSNAGIEDGVVQYFGTSKDILIRLPVDPEQATAEQSSTVVGALRDEVGEELAESPEGGLQQCVSPAGAASDCQIQMRRVEFVGPQVGGELTEKGGLAMLYALIGILIYVAIRFEWRFAVGSVVALIHDVLITLGIFSFLAIEFSLPVLAAILAVIGYSLNDTIVVFDRIRENFRKMRKGQSDEIMNRSINQTLPRTILTSLTTLLVVVTLIIAGGEIIKGFAIALLIGVIVGTYSSIFVASPTVLFLGISREDMLPVQKEGAEGDPTP